MMDRRAGTKNVNGKPHIDAIDPGCALPGGEIRITGSGLRFGFRHRAEHIQDRWHRCVACRLRSLCPLFDPSFQFSLRKSFTTETTEDTEFWFPQSFLRDLRASVVDLHPHE